MKAGNLMMILASAGLALTPLTAANATSSSTVARAMAPVSGVSYLQDEDADGDNIGGGATAVALGILLIVLFGVVVTSGGDDPVSP